MKKLILLLLLLPLTASAQFPMLASWQSAAVIWTPAQDDSALFNGYAADLIDSLGKSPGDTTYILPNRARFTSALAVDNAYQGTSSLKPTVTDSASGKSLQFDGADDYISVAAYSSVSPATLYVVFKSYRSLASECLVLSGSSGATQMGLYLQSAGLTQYAGALLPNGPPPARNDTLYVADAFFNNTASRISMNNRTPRSGDAGTRGFVGLSLGYLAGGSEPAGKVAIYEVHLTRSINNRANYKTHLQGKYGITLP